MKLRSNVFCLLDRNLVMGETVTGVYMHDVVRDYSRVTAGGDSGLQPRQCVVVNLLLAAAPAGGWMAIAEPLSAYVQRALRHHMSEALYSSSTNGDGQTTDNSMALDWLQSDTHDPAASFVVQQAANAVGSAALVQLAEETKVWVIVVEGGNGIPNQFEIVCRSLCSSLHVLRAEVGTGRWLHTTAWGGQK